MQKKRLVFYAWVRKNPLGEGVATQSSILARRSMNRGAWQVIVLGSQRVGHD